MGWVSGPELTAATSEAGGLGILAAVTLSLEEMTEAIAQIQNRTSKPFGVNFRPDQADIEDRISVLIERGIRVASFAGPPSKKMVSRLKDANIIVIPTVGARRHAEKMQSYGVDAVIAQGAEGGGHTGSVPTSILLPQVVDAVDIPVIAAGGFRDGRGLVAALALGAEGIAMGTRFLLTQESPVPDAVKQVYLDTDAHGTVVTRAIDGHPQRVVRTKMVDKLERSGWFTRFFRALFSALRLRRHTGTTRRQLFREGLAMKKSQNLTWSQTMMAANAPMLTRASMVDGKPEVGILPTGQVTGIIEDLPTVSVLISNIVQEAEDTLSRLSSTKKVG
jgi:NAD(P)H-dependent flavin oxidoreductase YrpB (nitropropane dioxygenase family)